MRCTFKAGSFAYPRSVSGTEPSRAACERVALGLEVVVHAEVLAADVTRFGAFHDSAHVDDS